MSTDFEVPKIKAFQQGFIEDIVERIENPPPPEPEPESRRLSAQENLNVNLSTKETCGRGRQMWNGDVLKRLLEGKQEQNSTCETAEFESQER